MSGPKKVLGEIGKAVGNAVSGVGKSQGDKHEAEAKSGTLGPEVSGSGTATTPGTQGSGGGSTAKGSGDALGGADAAIDYQAAKGSLGTPLSDSYLANKNVGTDQPEPTTLIEAPKAVDDPNNLATKAALAEAEADARKPPGYSSVLATGQRGLEDDDYERSKRTLVGS